MNVIVCLDDNGGMLFNKRRQSKDQKVMEDICAMVDSLWIHPFSEKLFSDTQLAIKKDERFMDCAAKEAFCFVENCNVSPYVERIERIVIYRWNRKYPADFYFDISLNEWHLKEQSDFEGKSHEKITKEVYEREA